MRLTPLEWGLRAPITPRLGGNCWALPCLGKIGAKTKNNKRALNTKLRILPRSPNRWLLSRHPVSALRFTHVNRRAQWHSLAEL
jgi:hypothetical protein